MPFVPVWFFCPQPIENGPRPRQRISAGLHFIDKLPLQVIELDRHQHKIVLSVVAYYKKRERDEFDKYLAAHTADTTTSMADAMPEELKAQLEQAQETETPEQAPPAEESTVEAEAETPEAPAEEATAEVESVETPTEEEEKKEE